MHNSDRQIATSGPTVDGAVAVQAKRVCGKSTAHAGGQQRAGMTVEVSKARRVEWTFVRVLSRLV